MTKHQLKNDQARLDCLSEADIIGDQEIDARHLNRPDDWIELVAFGLNSTSKR